eukprot:GHVU01208843.1.p1 GENE.GHVU01208843.1~~GHVU01208843.1.p1  ORF type:complete len:172 (+),score=17.70 GHVU01208843.1:64-516(+)
MPFTTPTVSSDYGYVLLAVASTFVMNTIHGFHAGKLRKAAKIPYPERYATAEQNKSSPEAMAFTCAQRSHGNFIENQPTAIASMLIAGLHHPRVAAGLGLFWTVNRYVYMVGYSSAAGPKGRSKGMGFFLAQFVLMGMSVWSGLQVAGLV